MKLKWGVFYLVSLIALGWIWQRPHATPSLSPMVSIPTEIISPAPSINPSTAGSPTSTPSTLPRPNRTPSETSQKSWTQFAHRFGAHLRPQFSAEGYLIKIHGDPRGESLALSETTAAFDPRNSILGLRRAKEILVAAQDLLHLESDWPLENMTIQNGILSCQIYWTQMHDGLPVLPGGTLKMELGQKGELLELQSTYWHSMQVANTIHLTQEEAESRVPGTGTIHGGNLLIWATSSNQAHIAYQMSRNGRQIILDADTGRILLNRDRRQF